MLSFMLNNIAFQMLPLNPNVRVSKILLQTLLLIDMVMLDLF